MPGQLLSATSGPILGPIANALGWVMNLIYNTIGFHSVVLSIVFLTIIIYMCMMPFTFKQQKFSRLSQAMQPEIQAIQNKYKGKKDQASVQAQNEELQLIYQKYGVSPMGSCLQMLISMPIFFALYRVFYNIPAYVTSIKASFGLTKAGELAANGGIVQDIINTNGFEKIIEKLMNAHNFTTSSGISAANVVEKLSGSKGVELHNYIVDILYKVPSSEWEVINGADYFNGSISSSHISSVTDFLETSNRFLGLNISETPFTIISQNFSSHNYLFVIIALSIPVLSYISQLINLKMMPTNGNNNANDQMANSMKTMNKIMPLFSFVMCFTVPVGLGIYWVVSAIVRIVQQFFINKYFDNMDLNVLLSKNEEKAKKAREKKGIPENSIRDAASIKTKSLSEKANVSVSSDVSSDRPAPKAGSMAAKANLVRDFNERNSQ